MYAVGCFLSGPPRNHLLVLSLTYEGLAGMKSLISICYIRLDIAMYNIIIIVAVKSLKYVNTLWLGV